MTENIVLNVKCLSTKFDKILFAIDEADVSNFTKFYPTIKARTNALNQTSYSISAKTPSAEICHSHGLLHHTDLLVGSTYRVAFSKYAWSFGSEQGISLKAYIKKQVQVAEDCVPQNILDAFADE